MFALAASCALHARAAIYPTPEDFALETLLGIAPGTVDEPLVPSRSRHPDRWNVVLGSPPPAEVDVVVALHPQSGLLVGAAQPRQHLRVVLRSFGGANNDVVVFVMRKVAGGYRLETQSIAFGKTRGGASRREIAIREVITDSADRFGVRMSPSEASAWGGSDQIFRFARRQGRWVLSGVDTEHTRYLGPTPDKASPLYGVVQVDSVNLLTGDISDKRYRYDAAAQRMVKVDSESRYSKGKRARPPRLDEMSPRNFVSFKP